MKRLLSTLTLSLLIASCGSGVTAKWSVEFKNVTDQQKEELSSAIERMIEGRTLAVEKELLSKEFTPSENGGTLTVTVSDEEAVASLKEQLAAPFSFRIMTQAEPGKGTMKTDQYGEFNESGLTEAHVDWVDARVPPEGGKTAIDVIFTAEGRTLLQKVFAENKGKLLGVFVRGRLMSLKTVAEQETGVSIVIDNVPSAQVASSFADDVNVSVHATFTEL